MKWFKRKQKSTKPRTVKINVVHGADAALWPRVRTRLAERGIVLDKALDGEK